MSSINVDYDVLNQKGSPAWFSDLFANLPTPGFKGRMFISTDTFAFYRDNGVGWDLVGGPGTGTITGAGVFGQVTFFSGTDTISGNTDFVWDNTNKRLGINTSTPGAPLDIHTTGTAAQFNGTGTNNAFLTFQNSGTNKWRTGNIYNSADNDYQIFDFLNSTARLTIKNTGATTINGTLSATSLIKSGGTSTQILLADGTTTPTSTFGAGSVTSVSAITLGTSGTDLSSSVVNSTTTPVITLNVPTASASNRGALSSADWTTFNNKQATITLTTTGTSGAATLVGATLNVPNYTNVGTVTSVSALTLGTSGTDLSSSVANSTSTPVITLNVPTASASNRGALSSADFTTFNNKQATISVTAPVVLTGATISMPAATTSVNGYLTSTDWNTFNNKSNTNGTVTNVVALTIDTSGIDITSTAVTTTTTPVITLNVPTASASNRGALSSTDWTTFNNKQETITLTTTGTSGAATFSSNTLNIPNYGSALSGYLPLTGGTLTGALTGTKFNIGSDLGYALNITSSGYAIIAQSTGSFANIPLVALNSATSGVNNIMSLQTDAGVERAAFRYDRGGDKLQLVANGNGLLVTGAATFSSSVTANATSTFSNASGLSAIFSNGGAVSNYNAIELRGGTAGTAVNWQISKDNSTGNAFELACSTVAGGTTYGSPVFIITNTGAATFSSSVTATSFNGTTNNIFSVNGTEGMRLTTTGLGIGTTSPASYGIYRQLVLFGGSTGGGLSIASGSTASGVLAFANGTSGTEQYKGFIEYQHSADNMVFGVNAATRLTIASTGAATFSDKLQVVSRGNFLNATDNALFSLNSGGTLYTVGFSPTATASSTATLSLTTGTTTWIYTGSGAATWTLPNPSGNNQIYWIKNAGTGAITLTAFSGTNIINNSAVGVSTVSIAIGATVVIAQDGNVKSYQLQ